MKVKLATIELKRAMKNITKIVRNDESKQVTYVTLTTKDKLLELNALGSNNSISINIEAEVIEPGKAITPSKVFYELINKLEDTDISLEVENNKFMVKTQSIKAGLPLISEDNYTPANYEKVDENSNCTEVNIDPKLLSEALFKTTPFCKYSNAEQNTPLKGILLKFSGKSFKAMATNVSMGVKIEAEIAEAPEMTINLPPYSSNIIQDLCKETKQEKVKLMVNEKKTTVIFKTDNITYYSMQYSGAYPDLERVFKQSINSNFITIDREKTLKSMERMNCFTEDKGSTIPLLMKFESENLLMNIKSAFGENEEQLRYIEKHKDQDVIVAVNCNYITNSLCKCNTDNIDIYINGKLQPLVIKSDNTNFIICAIRVANTEVSKAAA